MTRTTSLSVATLGLLCLLTGPLGCSDSNETSFDSIKGDPTPELLTQVERPVDAERNYAMMSNQNWRMFWQDIGRALYIDHPSRLSPVSAVYTSGQRR